MKGSGRAACVLSLLTAFLLGPSVPQAGFHLDDWEFLRRLLPPGGSSFAGKMAELARVWHWNRPLHMLHYPAAMTALGDRPWAHRSLSLALLILVGTFFFLALRELSGDEDSSLLAAAIAVALPTYTAVPLWMSAQAQLAAMALAFLSLWLHMRWLGGGGRGLLAAALACYAAALLEYESVAFLPALSAAGLWARELAKGRPRAEAAAFAARSAGPYLPFLLAYVAYVRLAVPAFLEPVHHRVLWSWTHAVQVPWMSLRCHTDLLFGLVKENAAGALRGGFGAGEWAGAAAGACGLAWLLVPASEPDRPAGGTRILAAAGLGLFLSAQLPYIASGVYTPRLGGVMDRVNMGGAFGLAILASCLLARIRGPLRVPALRATLASALFAFCIAHWAVAAQWGVAWGFERRILRSIAAGLPPGPVTVVLRNHPTDVRGAPVFWGKYDITYALRAVTGRSDVSADCAEPWSSWGPDSVLVENGDNESTRYPYEGLWVYDGSLDRLAPAKGLAALKRPGAS